MFIAGEQCTHVPTFELDASDPPLDDPHTLPTTPSYHSDTDEDKSAPAGDDELISSFRTLLNTSHPPRVPFPLLLYEPAVLPPLPTPLPPPADAVASPDAVALAAPAPGMVRVLHALLPSEGVLVSAGCREHSVEGEEMVAALLMPPPPPAQAAVEAPAAGVAVVGKTPQGGKPKGKGK